MFTVFSPEGDSTDGTLSCYQWQGVPGFAEIMERIGRAEVTAMRIETGISLPHDRINAYNGRRSAHGVYDGQTLRVSASLRGCDTTDIDVRQGLLSGAYDAVCQLYFQIIQGRATGLYPPAPRRPDFPESGLLLPETARPLPARNGPNQVRVRFVYVGSDIPEGARRVRHPAGAYLEIDVLDTPDTIACRMGDYFSVVIIKEMVIDARWLRESGFAEYTAYDGTTLYIFHKTYAAAYGVLQGIIDAMQPERT